MNLYTVPFYKAAPFVRLIFPFIAGILIQWTFNLSLYFLVFVTGLIILLLLLICRLSLAEQYKRRAQRGVFVNLLLAAFGSLLLYLNDDRNNDLSILHTYRSGSKLVVTINEPLTEKLSSYKTFGVITGMINGNQVIKTSGTILIYFEKKAAHPDIEYGDLILITADLQKVSTTGNPAAFDYRQYCFFQGIHHQVFLTAATYQTTGLANPNYLKSVVFRIRDQVVNILKKYIPGTKESGLAQALLIGYKDNLDKELVQAYSNTGVVHVIAISGLHLGLIYSILVLLTGKLKRFYTGRLLQLIIIITGIWLFAIIAGASASVVRSALMFTCIATGNLLAKNLSVYNSLAASAFLLLCYNPFFLWDTGFLLSYAAVLSILIYQKRVYDLLPITNRLLDIIWKTCAITLSAQVLTTPVSILYFHQFPNFFLLTNFVAIPLSSVILIAEILLCCIAFVSPAAIFVGSMISHLVAFMNWFVEQVDLMPFANWPGLQVTPLQALLLYLCIFGVSAFVIFRAKTGLLITLSSLLFFFVLRTLSFLDAANRHKLIVYNIAKTSAIEMIDGRNAIFIGDSSAIFNAPVFRFNISPSRIYHRINKVFLANHGNDRSYRLGFGSLTVAVLNEDGQLQETIDILVISGNPRGDLKHRMIAKLPRLVVFDSSNSRSKIGKWIGECRLMNIAYWSVPDEGAFVMNLN